MKMEQCVPKRRHVDTSRIKLGIRNFLFLVSFYWHLPAYEDGTDRVFWNVGIYLPKRKHTTYLQKLNFSMWLIKQHAKTTNGDIEFTVPTQMFKLAQRSFSHRILLTHREISHDVQ
jgi:hypothetical protein